MCAPPSIPTPALKCGPSDGADQSVPQISLTYDNFHTDNKSHKLTTDLINMQQLSQTTNKSHKRTTYLTNMQQVLLV